MRTWIFCFGIMLLSVCKMQAQNDPVLAGMIYAYTDKAEKELKNQEKVMLMQGHVQGRGGPGPGGGCGQRPGDGAPQNGLVQQAVLPVPDQAHGGGGQEIQQVDPLGRRLIHPEHQRHHQQQKGPAAYAPGRQHPAAHPGQQGQYKLLHSRYRTPP